MQIISSKENELVKDIKKLKEKKYRDKTKKYIVEGLKVVKEAIQENAKIDKIIINVEAGIDESQVQSKHSINESVR